MQDNGQPVVIKTIHKYMIEDEDEAKSLCQQLNWQMNISHPFILSFRDIFQGKSCQ